MFNQGKTYTLIQISQFMACTMMLTMEVQRKANNMVVYKEISKGVKKKHEQTLVLGEALVFEKESIPFTTDFEAVKNGTHGSFEGNAAFNLVGNIPIEEVRRFIEEFNLNPSAKLGDVIYKGVPVFPELSTDRILNLTNFPKANASRV